MRLIALVPACVAMLSFAAACSPTEPAAGISNDAVAVGSAGGAPVPADNMTAPSAAASAGSATPTAAADRSAEEPYLGRWIGVEGMYLDVTRNPAGGVKLDMQWDLDNKGVFDGSVTAEGLRFMRNGVAETAVRRDGDATGLKWLAGKKDCLTVKSGEGYCRA